MKIFCIALLATILQHCQDLPVQIEVDTDKIIDKAADIAKEKLKEKIKEKLNPDVDTDTDVDAGEPDTDTVFIIKENPHAQ